MKKCYKESRRNGIAYKTKKRWTANSTGHTLRRHRLPKHVTEIKKRRDKNISTKEKDVSSKWMSLRTREDNGN